MEKQQENIRGIVVQDVVETCTVKGLMVKTTTESSDFKYNHAPLSLFASPYPKHLYLQALDLQKPLGVMVADLIKQPQQIQHILRYFKEQDELMQRLLAISKTYNEQTLKQDIHLCILRSDYMIDVPTNSLKLVEYNTIASSFGCLCQKVREVQEYVRSKYQDSIEYNYAETNSEEDKLGKHYIRDIGAVFKRTIEHYQSSLKAKNSTYSSNFKDVWVLFVVDKEERNICDQKLIENEIFSSYGLKSMRLTLEQISKSYKLDEQSKILTIQGREVGFVYYRTGYQLEQHTSEGDWKAREVLECSMPIKCPSIDVHLTTFKKFQQAFGDETLLSAIMADHPSDKETIKHLFKGIWTLEDIVDENSEVQAIIKKAIQNPHDFVIKPQKEGGGHNYYDEDVKKMLLETDKETLMQYLIMERITPPEIKAYMLRNSEVIVGKTLSELGIFSSVFIDTTKLEVLENQTFGRLLRTKANHSNEGGVNAGFAVIDQPLITEIADLTKEILPAVKDF